MILLVRGPRVIAAVLVGAALAVAGAAFQGLFRNPLVSPDILGASSGAALGAVLGIYFSLGVIGIEILAFGGGLLAVAAVYGIGSALQSRDPILVLVLTGVVVGALLGAGVGLVKYLADPYNQLPAMTFWLLGSLAATNVGDLIPLAGPVALGTIVLVALRWRMNVMSLPEEEARALGVATGPMRIAIVVAATLVTSASVAAAGVIGWVGLVVPHLARALVGPDFPKLLPTCALLGGGYLLLIDTLARTMAPIEIPLGILTAVIGTPFFIWLLAEHAEELVVTLAGRNLTIGYSDRVVGRGLDVALRQGEVLALLGPNGGGKTTLLKTLLGILKPLAGEAQIDGRSLDAFSIRDRARRVAYVPQVHNPTFAFTVETVVLMGRTAHGGLVQPPVGARSRGGEPRAGRIRHRPSEGTRLHHDLRRRAATRPAGKSVGAGAAVHRARRAHRQSRLRQPGQGDARNPRAGGVRTWRAVHHPRSEPCVAGRRPCLSPARRRLRRRRRGQAACSPASNCRSCIAHRSSGWSTPRPARPHSCRADQSRSGLN